MSENEMDKRMVQAAAGIIIDAILDLWQSDPHSFSARGCQTCRAISAIAGRPFGCVLVAKQKQEQEQRP